MKTNKSTRLGQRNVRDPAHSGETPAVKRTSHLQRTWSHDRCFRAPCLAETIPIDFFSPNRAIEDAAAPGAEYLEFTPSERLLVCQQLEAAVKAIEQISETAGVLVREFVEVILPYKVARGAGSTSQPRFRGRVLLRGVETVPLASVVGALVHEAIHQLLYVLEYAGPFIVEDKETKEKARITSLWSGRALRLHSFFHACFVWYGLANFWSRPQCSELLPPADIERERSRCLLGFAGANPVDTIGLYSPRVRSNALRVARTLQDCVSGLNLANGSC
jgi:HEXXH motif-containing protein